MRQHNPVRAFLCATASCLAMSMTSAYAQDNNTNADEAGLDQDVVVVRGVRAAQEAAIDLKRSSSEIVDSIVSEDFGKLPDFTISDALQRVTGVQIQRVAGSGAGVSIRGSQEVLATLNGERFIAAESLLDPTADFQDIPASLVTGINVFKSQNASQTDGGVGGIIDIRTLRALTLDDGYTFRGSTQFGTGSQSKDLNFNFEGLVGANWGDRIAMSLTGSYSQSTNASSSQDIFAPNQRTEAQNNIDVNGDGDLGDTFILPFSFGAGVNSREFDRERYGLAYNLNADIGGGWEVIADVVYNRADDIENGQRIFFNGGGFSRPPDIQSVDSFIDASSQSSHDFVATSFSSVRSGFRAGVTSVTRETEALNTNLEFKYDNGGRFTGSIRGAYSDASRDRSDIIINQITDGPVRINVSTSAADAANGITTAANPNGLPFNNRIFETSLDVTGQSLGFTVDPALAALVADPSVWRLHSNFIDSTFTDADQLVLRADGSFEANDGLSFDFGVRFSERDTQEVGADHFSPSGIPGFLQRFNEFGFTQNQTTGVAAQFDFDPLPNILLEDQALAGLVTTVSDFGEVDGLDIAIPLIDSAALNGDFVGFRDRLYGQGQFIELPDQTYDVTEEQISGYFQTNFDTALSDSLNLSGNVGVRVVRTTVDVRQNVVQDGVFRQDIIAGDTDVNHTAFIDLGDINTSTTRTTALPSVNLNLDYNDDHRFKFSYNETQALQPFVNLGTSPSTRFFGQAPGETFARVEEVRRLGNPELDPTRQRSFSAAWEWYFADNALFSIGAFFNDVESFTFIRETPIDAPDSDGVVRDGAVLREIANGEGASYGGFEFAYQQTFDFLPGLLGNTGATINYTYSPSQSGVDGETGEDLILADGSSAPFNETAEHQLNAILFYEDDRLQARVAANYLSDQFVGFDADPRLLFPDGTVGFGRFIEPTLYIDANISYDVNDALTVFFNAQNITEESPREYLGFEEFGFAWNHFERVVSIGARARF